MEPSFCRAWPHSARERAAAFRSEGLIEAQRGLHACRDSPDNTDMLQLPLAAPWVQQLPPWLLIYVPLLTGAAYAAMAYVAWRHRQVRGAAEFALLLMALGIYATAYAFEVRSVTLAEALFWVRIEYIGLAFLPALWVLFVLRYTDRLSMPNPRVLGALLAVPIITLLLVQTSSFHSWYYRDLQLVPANGLLLLEVTPGPWHRVHVAAMAASVLAASVLLCATMMRAPAYHRSRLALLFAGSLFPALGLLANSLGWVGALDAGPLSMVVPSALCLHVLTRLKMFDLLPLARAAVFEALADAVLVVGADGRILDHNQAASRMLGPGRSLAGVSTCCLLAAAASGSGPVSLAELACDGLGQREAGWVDVRATPISDRDGASRGTLLVLQDVTARHEAEAALRAGEAWKSSLLAAIPDPLIWLDPSGRCREILNHGRIGEALASATAAACIEALPAEKQAELAERLRLAADSGQPQDWEFAWDEGSGTRDFEARLQAVSGNGFIAMLRDVTPRKQYERWLAQISISDQLTGLGNRAGFQVELDRLGWPPEQGAAVIIADLDGLKLVNDTAGHDRGDELLLVAANVLREATRASDVLARVGGDEFAVVLAGVDRQAAQHIVARVAECIAEHNRRHPGLFLSMSVGLAHSSGGAGSWEQLLKQADEAMYQYKLGRGPRAASRSRRAGSGAGAAAAAHAGGVDPGCPCSAP